jgi:hypothetical protein
VKRLLLLALAFMAISCGSSSTGPSSTSNPIFTASGSGDNVLALPSYVAKLRVTGSFSGNAANFIIWVGPTNVSCEATLNLNCNLLVNELLGTGFGRTTFDGTYVTGGQPQLQIIKSSGVSWTLTEVR